MPAYLSSLANHLWQSTLFAVAVGFLTLAFGKNRASVRYGLWLAASVKFLLPFSLLAALGSEIHWRATPAPTTPVFTSAVDQISRPFGGSIQTSPSQQSRPPREPGRIVLLGVWLCGFGVVATAWARQLRRIRAALRKASPLDLRLRIPALSSPSRLEPGIVGIFRPTLLLPEGIMDRLTPAQWHAILAHELCHAERRDNLTAAIQMVVEAIFWFHPLVWWIGAQLVKERERACDEEVLLQGGDREAYAEGILKVCKLYLESPLVCAAGVTGADLKKRVEEIMTGQIAGRLNLGKKVLLGAVGFAALAGPMVIGIVQGPSLRAQSKPPETLAFEVASIKENKSEDPRAGIGMQFLPGGRFVARNLPLVVVIATAYDLPPFGSPRLTTGPSFDRGVGNARYDIEATAEKGAIPDDATVKVRQEKVRLMLQTLLADRFKMVMRRETKEIPVYALTVAKGGPKLQKAAVEEKDCSENPTGPSDPARCHAFEGGQGRGLHAPAVSIAEVASAVENFADRPVVDKTGIQGLYNIQTEGWVSMRPRPPRAPGEEPTAEDLAFADPARPTIFQIFDRLGLKLESTKAPVEVFVIEHVEKPAEN